MPFSIRTSGSVLTVELTGSVTIRDAGALCRQLEAAMPPYRAISGVSVEAAGLSDIDTCILQLLCSLRKSAPRFALAGPPAPVLAAAIDRCGLRRELLGSVVREVV